MRIGPDGEGLSVSIVSSSTTVRCDLAVLQEVFDAPTADWLVPFIRIASLAGLADSGAARALADPAAERSASVQLGDRSIRIEPAALIVHVQWQTSGYGQTLSRFDGRFTAEVAQTGCTLTIRGRFGAPDQRDFSERLVSRQAGQGTLRAALDLLRTAVEESQHVPH